MKQKTAAGFAIRMIHAVFCFCFLILLVGVSSPVPASAGERRTYTFAVVPQFPPLLIKRYWTPLLEKVSREMGVELKLQFYKSIPDFELDLLKGVPDFAYMNPYQLVLTHKAKGYVPLVRDEHRQLVGILVVRADSAVKTVRDLDGKMLAFPSPNAFAASQYLRALLTKQERITFTPKYVTTHSNVYRHVILGRVPAGGGVNKTLDKEPQSLKALLRIIYRTPGVPAHPISAHSRVPPSVREMFTTRVLNLAKEPSSQALLRAVAMAKPVKADYRKDYSSLERLRLE